MKVDVWSPEETLTLTFCVAPFSEAALSFQCNLLLVYYSWFVMRRRDGTSRAQRRGEQTILGGNTDCQCQDRRDAVKTAEAGLKLSLSSDYRMKTHFDSVSQCSCQPWKLCDNHCLIVVSVNHSLTCFFFWMNKRQNNINYINKTLVADCLARLTAGFLRLDA